MLKRYKSWTLSDDQERAHKLFEKFRGPLKQVKISVSAGLKLRQNSQKSHYSYKLGEALVLRRSYEASAAHDYTCAI